MSVLRCSTDLCESACEAVDVFLWFLSVHLGLDVQQRLQKASQQLQTFDHA